VSVSTSFLQQVTVAELDADPYPLYARMRREQPVGYLPCVDTWFVTRYRDVQYVGDNPDVFTAEHGQSPVELTFGRPSIITVDGPVHHELRRSFDGKFRPRVVEGYIEELVRPIAEQYLARIEPGQPVDLMAAYFEPISVRALAAVLGLADVSSAELRRWFKGMNLGATNFERDPVKQAVADAVCAEIDDLAVPRMRQLALDPDDSTMAQLLHTGREPGCPREIDFVLPSLKVAILGGMQEPGHGAGSVLAGLFTRPDQLAEVAADRAGLLPAAVDEGLRWVAPIGTQFRFAVRDVELGGTLVPAGSSVSAVLASANRDEDVFAAPDTFDLHRSGREQAAFGFGKHFCSGHSFARHQMRIALDVLLAEFPAIAPAAAAETRFTGWEFRAPVELPALLA
jgi:cytochrome P450